MNRLIIFILSILLIQSCAPQTQHYMFSPEESYRGNPSTLLENTSVSYRIKPFDILQISVLSKNGERLIDPDFPLQEGRGSMDPDRKIDYRVDESGYINMPMVGKIEVSNLTTEEAEMRIVERFREKYDQPFAQLSISNKRAVILGSGLNQVVPLTYEGMTVAEVLATPEAPEQGKASNIRLIRNETVYLLDLSTIEGAKLAGIIVFPGDVLYIEPVDPTQGERLREISPAIGIITGLTSIVALIVSITR